MILIADSGSTKTDWAIIPNQSSVDASKQLTVVSTQGLNPIYLKDSEITDTILKSSLVDYIYEINEVYFYGSGVTVQQESRMKALLHSVFPHADKIETASDMLGAARAVCQHTSGIACILGTGANCGYYDGQRIVPGTPPALGYILGDEGSGAVLGKLFLNGIFKGTLPSALRDVYLEETHQTLTDVINRVYRQPLANRYLASASLFISHHLDCLPLRDLVVNNFRTFFRINLHQNKHADYPIGVIGSIGYHYAAELREAAQLEGFTIGVIAKSPLEGLVTYHQK